MRSYLRRLPAILIVIVLALGALFANGLPAAPLGSSPFEVAELFLELNDTDGDLGLHAEVDGDEWTTLEVLRGSYRLLELDAKGALRDHGLTQLAFESTEPEFEDLLPDEFFDRFPEGEYEIAGRAHQGDLYLSLVSLSHVLAAPPAARVSGVAAAPSCDHLPLPEVQAPVTIEWDPVGSSHPTIGRAGPVTIARYQVFVEQGDFKLGVDLPPDATGLTVPSEVTANGGIFKFEIIARTTSGNNTAIESCFVVQ